MLDAYKQFLVLNVQAIAFRENSTSLNCQQGYALIKCYGLLQYYNIRISRPMLVRMNRIKGMLS